MNKETIEEAAERLVLNCTLEDKQVFVEGAKWQQEQDKNKYNEEEILELLKKFHFVDENYKEWFDKNKKS